MANEIQKQNTELANMSEQEIVDMIKDTSNLAAQKKAEGLSSAAAAFHQSRELVSEVEFWKLMDKSFQKSGIFHSNEAMQEYIANMSKAENPEKALMQFKNVLKGKGYEWDYVQSETMKFKNLFKKFALGDSSTQPGFDIEVKNVITDETVEKIQAKAYTSGTKPDLHNAPIDTKVVTNKENVDYSKGKGYDTTEFQNNDVIDKRTNDRYEDIKRGKATPMYTPENIAIASAKAGVIGCVFGMGIEAMVSYKKWKSGEISDSEYLKEIGKAGGDAGVTAAATTAIMIPVQAAIIGSSTLVAIPVAIIVSAAVNKIVAPIFGRGAYREILGEAKYYQDLNKSYANLVDTMAHSADEFYKFVQGMGKQQQTYNELQRRSLDTNRKLKDLYDSI